MFLQGHGLTYEGDSMLIVPQGNETDDNLFLNITNIAKKFAMFERCISVLFLDACRELSSKHENLVENVKETYD